MTTPPPPPSDPSDVPETPKRSVQDTVFFYASKWSREESFYKDVTTRTLAILISTPLAALAIGLTGVFRVDVFAGLAMVYVGLVLVPATFYLVATRDTPRPRKFSSARLVAYVFIAVGFIWLVELAANSLGSNSLTSN